MAAVDHHTAEELTEVRGYAALRYNIGERHVFDVSFSTCVTCFDKSFTELASERSTTTAKLNV